MKVSVIMSVFNDEAFVAQSITAVLNSSFKDFEFIICNDCSSDNSAEIIKSFKDERIVFFSNSSNSGLANSLNNCLKRATGEFVFRIDSDDITHPDRMAKQVEFLTSHPECAMCGTYAYVINNSNQQEYEMTRPTDVTITDIFKNRSFIHPSMMIRKSVLDEVGGYVAKKETRRAEDFDLWCRIYERGYVGKNIPEFLLDYREDYSAYKKRKFKYRIDVYKLMCSWRKRLKLPLKFKFYALKILLVGLIPKRILFNMKRRKNKAGEQGKI